MLVILLFSVFGVVVTDLYVGFVELSSCRVGRVVKMDLTSSLRVIRTDRLYCNYVNTNIKRYRL